jgi:pyruvate/2-oxoglutarate dehydrogenase complex dihydrolipoamide acyltransferase (E2) component
LVYEFKLPDIGEGVAEAEILKWMVKEGDGVKEEQPLVEVMTDKVNVQIPAPRTGTVSKILVKEGDVAKVGQTIVVIDEGEGGSPAIQPKPMETSSAAPTPSGQDQGARLGETHDQSGSGGAGVLATPSTRRLARELGVDLSSVKGSGPQGRVTDDDVRSATAALVPPTPSRPQNAQTPSVMTTQAEGPQQPLRQRPPAEREEVVPLRGVRKTIAEHLAKSKETAVHVTHVDEADMSELVLLREALKGSAERKGVRLTYLPLIIKALVPAFREFPYVNASLDEQSSSIVLKRYYNMGIATDTPQGLVVPVVRDVDTKDMFQIAGEIEKLASKARDGQLTLNEVRGSTFTITNVGAIGGLFSTPIINYPEVAILGLQKVTKRVVVHDGKLEIKDMAYISLTFDHRVLDGAYAARFTSRLIDTLQDTKKLLSAVL